MAAHDPIPAGYISLFEAFEQFERKRYSGARVSLVSRVSSRLTRPSPIATAYPVSLPGLLRSSAIKASAAWTARSAQSLVGKFSG